LLSALLKLSLGLKTHDASTPSLLRVVVELSFEVLLKSSKFVLIFLVDFGDGNNSGVLLVGKGAESCFAFHDTEWDIHLTAKGRKPNDILNGVYIVSNTDHLGFLGLYEVGYVLKTILKYKWGDDSGGGALQQQLL
jgi:hypothetical protein